MKKSEGHLVERLAERKGHCHVETPTQAGPSTRAWDSERDEAPGEGRSKASTLGISSFS